MPNIRLVLWGVLAAILFLNYQTWLHDYEPPVSAVTQTGTGPAAPSANTLGDTVPQATTAASAAAPEAANAPPATAAPAPTPAAPAAAAESESSVPLHITTDVLDVDTRRKQAQLSYQEGLAQLTQDYVALQKSLGLGWADPSARE